MPKNNQPGFMLYFDIKPAISRLSDSEKGILLMAIFDYAELGVVPQLDGMSGMCWDFIKPKLDRDRKKYEQTCLQRQYAVFCREIKKRGEEPLDFEEWSTQLNHDNYHSISSVETQYPTITPTETIAPTSTEPTTPASTTKGVQRDVNMESGLCTLNQSENTCLEKQKQEAIHRIMAYKRE